MIRVRVRLRRALDESHDILIGRGLGPRISVDLRRRRLGRRYIIVTDSHLKQRYGVSMRAAFRRRGLAADLLAFRAGEASKTRRVRDRLEDAIIALGAGRDSVLVALGGGVVGDLTGFVAATFNRGIPVVQIPTTLTGMVDSAIGGKTGINHPAGKNFVGAFHQPAAIYMDVDYLRTLPPRHFNAGMAEVVKYGVIADRALFLALETHLDRVQDRDPDVMSRVIESCCRIKARVVATDPREENRRAILNFGHTVGHALETLTGYALAHGEAVAIGMVAEAALAARAGLLAAATVGRIARLLARLHLPTSLPSSIDPVALLRVAHRDKKARQGRIAYALPVRLGAMAHVAGSYAIPVEDGAAVQTLREMVHPRRFVIPSA